MARLFGVGRLKIYNLQSKFTESDNLESFRVGKAKLFIHAEVSPSERGRVGNAAEINKR